MSQIIKFTEKQLYEYIRCPAYYDLVNGKKIAPEQRPSITSLLEKIGNAFMLNLMNGTVLTQDQIKKRWDTVCEDNSDRINPNKCMEGISLLMKMYLWAESEEIRIADIQTPYTITFKNMTNLNELIDISGEMSAIAFNKKEQCEFLILDFSNRFPDQNLLDMKLKYTLDCYGFLKLYQKSIGVHIHHVKSGKDLFTYRIKDDFLRLNAAVTNIATSIKERLFYPRESVLCTNCELKNFCKGWKG